MERDSRIEDPNPNLEASTTCITSAFEGYNDLDSFIEREFDVTGLRRKGYRVSGFRSDGL